MRVRIMIGAAVAALSTVMLAAPAFAHATFPANANATGTTASPYPTSEATYIVLRVPEERPGPPKLDNADVAVEIPDGFSDPVCEDALVNNAGVPGGPAAGWSCVVEPGLPTKVHWTRAAGATGIAIYFPFTVTTSSTAGTYTFIVRQTYSSGEKSDWVDPATPPGCSTGVNMAGTACNRPAPTRVVSGAAPKGLWQVAGDGGVFTSGDAGFFGSTGDMALNKPIVGIAPTPTGKGYWLVASDGGIFSFGDAAFFGSTGSMTLNKPIVGMGSTPTGKGYWLVASDGGIFSFGDAAFLGSTGAIVLNKPIVGMGLTPSGAGYWLVASDGGIFSFGDAGFFGSTGAIVLNKPIVSMTPSPSGQGYLLLASDGGIFSFGNAGFQGSSPTTGNAPAAVGLRFSPTGRGYWVTTSAGQVTAFGDAPPLASTGALNRPVVGAASV
jgi:hypothetical protein